MYNNKLNPTILERIKALTDTYDSCLRRIRASAHLPKAQSKKNGINRIFYLRDEENKYDVDELYEDALQWLVDARLVHNVYFSTAPGIPVSAYDDLSAFKIYLVDVGLLRRLAQLAPTAFGEGNRLFTEFKGALTENYALQTLITQLEVMPRYWSQTNPPYEVDFLIQRDNDIFPVEVKSEANTTSNSLRNCSEIKQSSACVFRWIILNWMMC